MSRQILRMFLLIGSILLISSFASATTIQINNVDGANQGFNDPTPVAPVGGNAGTTVGAQRLNVFNAAAAVWAGTLNSSVTIIIQSTFEDRGFTPCTATSAVLGAAGAIQIEADFPNAQWPHTWYQVALANKLAGVDLHPGPPDPGFLDPASNDDIIAFFNPNLGQANCLAGSAWYYGLDHNEPAGQVDLFAVLEHEFGHGLGFANFIDEAGSNAKAGSGPNGLPDIYSVFTHDDFSGKQWNQMSDNERAAAAVRDQLEVWNGPKVVADAPSFLGPLEQLKITSGSLNGTVVAFGTAGFGATADHTNFSGGVVLANDGTGVATDGCEPLTNGGSINGHIALMDRGTCTFVVKVKNAQNAGATGAIIANTLGRGAFGLGGSDPTIVIPSVGISNADGDAIKADRKSVV